MSRKPMVVLMAVPDTVPDQMFSTTDEHIWSWLGNDSARRYAPDASSPFLRAEPKGTYGGVIVEERYDREPTTYLAVERSGAIELASFDKVGWIQNGRLYYHSAAIAGLIWQFLGFACDLYRTLAHDVDFSLFANVRSTDGAMLGGFFQGWLEPYDSLSGAQPCVESGLHFVRKCLRPTMTPDEIASLVRDLATELGNAWGHREARCYAHIEADPQRPFATAVFRSFVNR